jgi:hypothetical protein
MRLFFLVQETPEGGYTAQAIGHAIFTEADTWGELKEAVQDAVRCHFEDVPVKPLLEKYKRSVLIGEQYNGC